MEKNIHKKYFQILSITKIHKNSQKNHKSVPFWAAATVIVVELCSVVLSCSQFCVSVCKFRLKLNFFGVAA